MLPVVTKNALPLLSEDGPVTLITTFRLREDTPLNRFVDLWTDIGNLMAGRTGFVSSRLYRAKAGADPRDYIQVANWSHATLLANARSDPEMRWMEGEVEKLVIRRSRVLCDASTEEILPPG